MAQILVVGIHPHAGGAFTASGGIVIPMETADWGAQGIMQVTEAVTKYGKALGISVVAVYGGTAYGPPVSALRRGVDAVRATGDPSAFLHTVRVPPNPPTVSCDLLVAGAGAGGFAAALRAADYGCLLYTSPSPRD